MGEEGKSLFEANEEANRREAQPLAARMRPTTLDEFVGQEHFLGEGKLLRRLLKADRLGSVIFYGPPGTGKSMLAIANLTRICETHLPGRYEIEVLDLCQNPSLARRDQILIIPTLVKRWPGRYLQAKWRRGFSFAAPPSACR